MIPTRIGQLANGGYFTGVIRIRNSAYAIIVAPKWSEITVCQLKTTPDATLCTQSVNDGLANTHAMNDSSHPVVQHCCNITLGGYNDWYLPSRDELELCYHNLKPTSDSNLVYHACEYYTGNLGLENGTNPNSVPPGLAYTLTAPLQTIVTSFCASSKEAFYPNWYWASTEYSVINSCAMMMGFSNGIQDKCTKTYPAIYVRAVRRELLYSGTD